MKTYEKVLKHFVLITKHKLLVTKLCFKAGIPLRGFLHDLSKYGPTEFFESAKYYTGNHSPILECRKYNGYSMAWIHHKAYNKHHYEYWIDNTTTKRIPVIIPFKYSLEMVCDMLAAGIIYKKKDWNKEYPLSYWLERCEKIEMHPANKRFLTSFFSLVAINGLDILNYKFAKNLYEKSLKDVEQGLDLFGCEMVQ